MRFEAASHSARTQLELLVHQALVELPDAELMTDLVHPVTAAGAGTIAMTTGLQGAGGFGKTTLARLLVHEPAVRESFTGGAVWVTIGQDVRGADLADKFSEVCAVLTGSKPPLSDPLLAGAELGRSWVSGACCSWSTRCGRGLSWSRS